MSDTSASLPANEGRLGHPATAAAAEFVSRLAILDKQQGLIGYELRFSDAEGAGCTSVLKAIAEADTWPVGKSHVFLPMRREFLSGDPPSALVPERTVFVMNDRQATASGAAEAVVSLRKRGYRVCLEAVNDRPEAHPLITLVDYVRLDWRALGPRLAEVSWRLRGQPVKQIVARVRHKSEFANCIKVGVDAVQGDFFLRPGTLKAKGVSPARANIATLMSLVRDNAEMKKIDEVLRRDASISYKLLRYINSAAFGLSTEVQSFRHAVTLLGYEKLASWLGILLVSAGDDALSPALTKAAVVRGQFAALVGKHCLPAKECDDLFIVGLFSLLDVMMEMRMEAILEQIKLGSAVANALLRREGPYGGLLALIEACEGGDFERSAVAAAALKLDFETVNRAHLEAIDWVERLPV